MESLTLNDFLTQEKYQKEYELKNVLLNHYKENNIALLVSLNYSDDGNITQAYIFVIGQDENPDSEILSGMRSLASEELELDTQNIFIDLTGVSIDFESQKHPQESKSYQHSIFLWDVSLHLFWTV